MVEAARYVLMYFVLPVWILIGLADWFCHRRSRIEQTSGPIESVFHLLALAEVGAAVMCALLLEINAAVLAVMLIAFALHAVTAWADVRYANDLREITPIEQTVHNYLEGVPLLGLGIVIVLHFEQFIALFGFGPATPDFSMRWKSVPLPFPYLALALGATAALNIIPFFEELIRGIRAQIARTG